MKSKWLLVFSMVGMLASCSFPGPISSSKEEQSSQNSTTSETSQSSAASSTPKTTSSSIESVPSVGYVKIFAPKEYTHVWAWYKDGGQDKNYFPVSWPGEELNSFKPDTNWKTYDFTDRTDIWVIVSINGNSKSADAHLTSAGNWWYYNNEWTQTDPRTLPPTSSSSSSQSYSEESIPSFSTSTEDLDARHRTWYQLLVYSFADSNNDGWGDFQGIINHLDYLQGLGVGGLWLSPIHPSDSYHGYDVKDYRGVRYEYEQGGADFAKLLSECHKRDIKVIMDMVFNHTSNNHPWRSQHSDWYTGEYIFGGGMPDLNYDKPELRTEIKNIGKYWLDKGVDGFRCDAAAWIYGGGGQWKPETDKFAKSVAWWKEFSTAMEAVKSDVYLIGEVYTELQWVEEYYKSHMNAFNFSASYWAKDAMQNSDPAKWVEECVGHQQRVRKNYVNGVEASFLSNHDTGRFASQGFNKEQLIMGNVLNVLSPGGSYIYYGDELGMTGSSGGWKDMSFRTPMPFASGKTNANSYMGNNGSSNTKSGKTADADASDTSSIYSKTALAVKFKNANPGLYWGEATQINTGKSSLGAMQVKADDKYYTMLINSTGSSVSASVTGSFDAALKLHCGSSTGSSVDGGSITMPSLSVYVLESSAALTVTAA